MIYSVFQFYFGFQTHSEAEVPSFRDSNISADLRCLSEDRPLCDVTMSHGFPIKWEEWLKAENEAWQGKDHHQHHHLGHACLPGNGHEEDEVGRRRNQYGYAL